MRIQTTFEESFDALYNKFNITERGKKLLDAEGISRDCLDIGTMSKAYFTQSVADMSVDSNSNANEQKSPNNYASEVVKGITKLDGYYLIYHYAKERFGEERANELISSVWSGDVYFHDASRPMIPYCFAYSTSLIMIEGRPYGQLFSMPPKRADSFVAQVIETTMDLSQEFAGAIAPSDFLINYAWYSKRENLPDKVILNDLQKFVHVMNNKFRVSAESPFTNISLFDRPNLEKVFGHYSYPDGSKVDFDYVMHIQKIFGEWFSHGDPVSQMPYRFPIVTINLYCDENKNIVDKEFLDWASKVNTETGCFNIYVNSGHKIASCCRLVNDMERMKFRADTFGNGGLNLGSHRVVTVNLPRIALKSEQDMEGFYQELSDALNVAIDLLRVHREEILQRRVDQGFLKFFNPLKWFKLDHMFSTIGVIGIYEMCYLMGIDIKTDDGIAFVTEVLNFIEDAAKQASVEQKHSFNVEEIPGESVATKLVQKDRIMFGEDEVPFELYSNQYIPLIANASMPERITLSGKFQDLISGGGILHLNIKDKITDSTIMKHLIEYSVANGVSHVAINYSFGACEGGHISVCGNSEVCPICGKRITKHMTRVIGYFAIVTNWNKVRRNYEFPRRVFS